MATGIAYFDCFAGISGDMTLGALVDAGADFQALQEGLSKLGIGGYEISAAKTRSAGISATDVTVRLTSHEHGHGRGFSDIRRIIEDSALHDTVKSRSVAIFRRLGEAEAKVHGAGIDEVHFHEVGAVDAIVDIVGTCICLDLLGVDEVLSSPMPTFTGTVEVAHGVLPLPAPATVEILAGAPWRELGVEGELVTPTGAAIVAELTSGYGPMPEMSVRSVGYGAGKKDFGIPNVLRVMVGDPAPTARTQGACGERSEVAVMETNIDDLVPQVYEVVMERLFAAGALDVYLTPVQMKKNRPATLLTVVCAPEDTQKMSDVLFEETSTIGIRTDLRSRTCLQRDVVTVDTKYGPIGVKVARRAGQVINVQPEYDDCKSVAARSGVGVKLVRDEAIARFLSAI